MTQVADDLWFANGSVITPDGRTLIVDETFGNRISAFDIHEDGSLGERRDWAKFGELPGSRVIAEALPGLAVGPDGCGLDAEGCLWVADAMHARVLRVREGGEVAAEIQPGTGVFACMLGGAEGTTLVHVLRAGLRRAPPQRRPGGGDPCGHRGRAARRSALNEASGLGRALVVDAGLLLAAEHGDRAHDPVGDLASRAPDRQPVVVAR